MASSIPSCSFYPCCASNTTRLPLSFPHPIFNRISISTSRISAKFDKFQGESPQENLQESTIQLQEEEKEEDDSCLPSDLEGAVQQSGQAAALFVSSGGMRAIKIKAIFPDAGAAALLKYQWKDAAFGFASLSDRKPVENEDEIVVMVVPDYQMLRYVEKIASSLADEPPRPLIMWNPRLISEDVGVGINVRNLRRYFLRTFSTVYSMRPLPSGAVFRCYPGIWKVFYDDKDRPNRYLLAKELISRPDAEELEIIFGGTEENSEQGPSFFTQAAGVFSSVNRFMRTILK